MTKTALLAVLSVLAICSASNLHAQLAVSTGAAGGATSFDTSITTNLITQGQATLASVDAPESRNNPTFTAAGLNDDSAATSVNTTYYEVAGVNPGVLPATITFALNTNAATGGSANGYTIYNIQSIAGYSNSNLADQNLQVLLSTDGGTNYTSLGDYTDNTSLNGGANSTDLSFTNSTGVIAQNVTDVQFIYTTPTASDNGGAGGTVLRELEVFGYDSSPTATPEPRAYLFAGLVIGLMVALRYRQSLDLV